MTLTFIRKQLGLCLTHIYVFRWLFACARTGRRETDSDYLIEKIFNKTSDQTTDDSKQTASDNDKPSQTNQVESGDNRTKQQIGRELDAGKTNQVQQSASNTSQSAVASEDSKSKQDTVVKKPKKLQSLKANAGEEVLENSVHVKNLQVETSVNDNGKNVTSFIIHTSENLPMCTDANVNDNDNSKAKNSDSLPVCIGTNENDNSVPNSKAKHSENLPAVGDKVEFVASSSAENSDNLPVTIDNPMADVKALLESKKQNDSQKENVSLRSTRNMSLSSKPQHSKVKVTLFRSLT